MAGFLNTIDFDYFSTFTFPLPCGLVACRSHANRLANHLDAGKVVSFFWCAEPHELKYPTGQTESNTKAGTYVGSRYHFHALIKGPVDKFHIWNYWRERYKGRADIIDNREPDRQLKASHYLSKYVTKRISDYDIHLAPAHRFPTYTTAGNPDFDRETQKIGNFGPLAPPRILAVHWPL